jgi:transposase
VRRLKQRRREFGSIAPRPNHPGPKPKLTDVHRRQLSHWLAQQPGLTLMQLQRRLPIRVCLETINRALHQMKLTLKKNH